MSFWSKIWLRHSLRRPIFPVTREYLFCWNSCWLCFGDFFGAQMQNMYMYLCIRYKKTALTILFSDHDFLQSVWAGIWHIFYSFAEWLFRSSGQKTDPDIRSRDLDFLSERCISNTVWRLREIFYVFEQLCRMTLWPRPLTFPFLSFICSATCARPTYQFRLSKDYRVLSYNYWIFDHSSNIWNSHGACLVSQGLSPRG